MVLVILASIITFFIGFIQTLSTPMFLAFTNTSTLGIAETICASGMLATSILIGVLAIKKGYVKMLAISLFGAGLFMGVFGLRENVVLICVSGFLFFAMMPFANTALDVLVRNNIENSVQGRAWGLIGVISQLGYVAAYALSGVLADYVFTPMLVEDGVLADSVGKFFGTGVGRGTGLLISLAGVMLAVCAIVVICAKSVRKLENSKVSENNT